MGVLGLGFPARQSPRAVGITDKALKVTHQFKFMSRIASLSRPLDASEQNGGEAVVLIGLLCEIKCGVECCAEAGIGGTLRKHVIMSAAT